METPQPTKSIRPVKPHHYAIIAAIVVGLIAAAVYGTLLWRQQEIDQLTANNNSLLKQLQASPKASASPTTTPAATAAPTFDYTSTKGVTAQVFVPRSGAKVTSPIEIIGQVPGSWSFEAQFPVELQNSAGATIATGQGRVQGNWTTTKLVPFTSSFEFTPPAAGTSGWLVLRKDNPSGLPANDDSIKVPVTF